MDARWAPGSVRAGAIARGLRSQTLGMFCIAMTCCAHTPSSVPPSTVQEPSAVSGTSPLTPDPASMHSEVTPEEVGRRFLMLVDSLKSFDALSATRVRERMQLPMTDSEQKVGAHFSAQRPESGWEYSFSYRIDPEHVRYTNATLEFTASAQNIADTTPACHLDFDTYVNNLQSIGFTEVEGSAEYESPMPHPIIDPETGAVIDQGERRHFRIPTYLYSRADVGVVIRQRGDTDAPDSVRHGRCVESISVGKAS